MTSYSAGIYAVLVFITEFKMVKLTLNSRTKKFHQPIEYDLAKSMPFEVRKSKLQVTNLQDFKNEPIFKCKNDSFTWFFCLNTQDVIPYLVFESDAWAVNSKILSLKKSSRNRLYDDEKQVFEAPDSILDISEVNKQLLVLLANEVIFLNTNFKVIKKIALRTFGGKFLNPYNSIV